MSNHQINVQTQNTVITISALTDETLLECLARAQITTKQACRNGACGICLCKLKSGTVDYRGRVPRGLNTNEIAQGFILPCIAYADSELVIEEPKVKRLG